MAFDEVLLPYLKTKRFWTDFFWITNASDLEKKDAGGEEDDDGDDGDDDDAEPYADLSGSGLELRFGDDEGVEVSVEIDEYLSYFPLRFSAGSVFKREIAHDDQAHWHPYVLRWSELELLCQAAARAEPDEITHPGPALLFLYRFAPICVGDDVDHIMALLDAAWRSVGVFSDAEIRRLIERADFRGAGFKWFYDEGRDYWWIGKGENADDAEGVYTQRYKKESEGKDEEESKRETAEKNDDGDGDGGGDDGSEEDDDDEEGFPSRAWNKVIAEAKRVVSGQVVAERSSPRGNDEQMTDASDEDEEIDDADEDEDEAEPTEKPHFEVHELRKPPYQLRQHHSFQVYLELTDKERPMHQAAGRYFYMTLDGVLRALDLGTATSSGCSSTCINGEYVTQTDHISMTLWARPDSDDERRGLILARNLLLWLGAPTTCRVLRNYKSVEGWSMSIDDGGEGGEEDSELLLGIAKPAELPKCSWLVSPTLPKGVSNLLCSAAVLGAECRASDPTTEGWVTIADSSGQGEMRLNLARPTSESAEGVGCVALPSKSEITPAVARVLYRFMDAAEMTLLPAAITTKPIDEELRSRWPRHRVVENAEELRGILTGGLKSWWEGKKRPVVAAEEEGDEDETEKKTPEWT